MKKSFLLPFCLLCACGFSACSSFSTKNEASAYIPEEEAPVIDATVNPNSRCGVNGISCNDTALVNYTKTEADYRAYGERTKRDHLYTQSAAGNNLTATIQPDVEDEIVVAQQTAVTVSDTVRKNRNPKYIVDDGVFSETGTLELEPSRKSYEAPSYNLDDQTSKKVSSKSPISTPNKAPQAQAKKPQKQQNKIGHADNIKLPEIKEIRQIRKSVTEDGSSYEIVCEEDCDDIINDNVVDDDVITSEFTEESFDIADYIDDENIEFTEVGQPQQITDIDINEIQVGDDTILTWEAEEGENLRELLTKWSAMSGWKLLWNTNRNYILNAGVMFKGKFADVSSALIRAFARARPAPIATYYKGNRVIVVETMENENAY